MRLLPPDWLTPDSARHWLLRASSVSSMLYRRYWIACILACFVMASIEAAADDALRPVVDTDNSNRCDESDPLARKYKENFVTISGKARAGGYFNTAGFLIDHCSKVVTAGHVLYEKDLRTRLTDLQISTLGMPRAVSLGATVRVKEGPWLKTQKYKDETSLIEVPAARFSCSATNLVQDDHDIETLLHAKTIDVYLLKLNANSKLCAQRCNQARMLPDTSAQHESGSIEHDCSTVGGNSGSPVFARSQQTGKEYFIGVHTGPHPRKPRWNLFAPVTVEALAKAAPRN